MAELWLAYRLRWKRRRYLYRVLRKRRQIAIVKDQTGLICSDSILAFVTLRNEVQRLPYFLDHYRRLGVDHFLMVDNGSTDGSAELLAQQPDVSLWSTEFSYRLSRFGVDWIGWLLMKYGHNHWCLTLDADELFIYPHHDRRDLRDLTTWLIAQGRTSFGALMVDAYPEGPIGSGNYKQGDDPLTYLTGFDAKPHRQAWHPVYDNLWIQGGVRDRVFFQSEPRRAPTLNKTPLVYWNRRYAYVSSTHQLLPRRLHNVFGSAERPLVTGALMHTKFLPEVTGKSEEELQRRQHFENSALYDEYYHALTKKPVVWHRKTQRYKGWEQLVELGLMTKGDFE